VANFRWPDESLMLANHEPDWNIDDLSDTEICAAIHYLESDPKATNNEPDDLANDDGWAVAISVIFVVLMFGLGFILFYW
jgi:hypothetical protein